MRGGISRGISIVGFAVLIASAAVSAEETGPQAATVPAAAPAPGEPAAAPPVQLPFWMTPNVLKAAIGINMNDAQKHNFNEVVGQYVTDHFAMVQKEAKRESADLDQRVKSRDGALARKMDDQMQAVLTPQQMPAYENYRKVLREELKTAPLPQTSTGQRSMHGVGGGQG